jgi:hypothetical protein
VTPMKIVLSGLGLVALLVVWRLYATIAGGERAYNRLLAEIAPITRALAAGHDPAEADLVTFASDRRTRRVLYDVLDHQRKLHLFPRQFLTWEAMAEADLAAWLNHPNELGSPPDEMELMTRARDPGVDTHYFLFRFRMRPPHWAAKDGWLAGVAGPYDLSQEPKPYGPGTFSRFESFDSRTPEQHVEMIDGLTSKRRP